MHPVDREGIFRAEMMAYGLKKFDSGAVSVSLRVELIEWWNPTANDGAGGWHPWAEYEQEVEGDLCIVKKDGTLNESQVDSLINFAGWDGDIDSILNETWRATPFQVVIGRDVYKEKSRYRISFVNDYNRTPGAMSNVDRTVADDLKTRYGSMLRAKAGNRNRNTSAPPTGTAPPAPPPPPPTTQPGTRNGAPLPNDGTEVIGGSYPPAGIPN